MRKSFGIALAIGMLLIAAPTARADSSRTLIDASTRNGSFEQALTGWMLQRVKKPSTVAASRERAAHGSRSARFTLSPKGPRYMHLDSAPIAVSTQRHGERFVLRTRFQSDGAIGFRAALVLIGKDEQGEAVAVHRHKRFRHRDVEPGWHTYEFDYELGSRPNDPAILSEVKLRLTTFRRRDAESPTVVHFDDVALRQIEPAQTHAPIPITFELDEPGYVTLVIENANGNRVKNLISETKFDAGEHTVYWDGKDESIYDPAPVRLGNGHVRMGHQGIYNVKGKVVEPGTYQVRGLVRDRIDMRYQFTVYNGGNPPWVTREWGRTQGSGGWLADHSPPLAIEYLPAGRPEHPRMRHGRGWSGGYKARGGESLIPSDKPLVMIGSHTAEAGDTLVWTDLQGHKVAGLRSYGSKASKNFAGIHALARDAGPKALEKDYAYYVIGQRGDTAMVRALPDDRNVLTVPMESQHLARPGALAAHNGLIVLSLRHADQLAIGDARTGELVKRIDMPHPYGVQFDAAGRLVVVTQKQIHRYALDRDSLTLTNKQVLVTDRLQDPHRLAMDEKHNIYVSDWGDSHQVKVFTKDGKHLRNIGAPGAPGVGRYNKKRMSNPYGMTVTPDGRLWVTEYNTAPKRVSVWSRDGELLKTFYGPSSYGGGGRIDPKDPTRFYYAPWTKGAVGMEFKLDWEKGTSELVSIYARDGHGTALGIFREQAPQYPIYLDGRQYMTNCYIGRRTAGSQNITIALMGDDKVARPVAAFARPHFWERLKDESLRPVLPDDFDFADRRSYRNLMVAWSDLNGDHDVQRDELTVTEMPAAVSGLTVNDDLSVISEQSDRITPRGFTDEGAPIYKAGDFKRAIADISQKINGTQEQALQTPDGFTIITGGPQRGFKNGQTQWTYPSRWPSLHASHQSPKPQHPGQMIGTTRLLGPVVTPKQGESGPIWAINGNAGVVYLMTSDGLFLASLGKDGRVAPNWGNDEKTRQAKRGLLINHVSLVGESFFPTINRTPDGEIYLVHGKAHSSIVHLDNLDSIRRFEPWALQVTSEQIAQARQYELDQEKRQDEARGRPRLTVRLRDKAPTLDGKLDDWTDAMWAEIEPGTYAAMRVKGDKLYVAYRTRTRDLIQNAAPSPRMLFKYGGALDIKLGTDAQASPDRRDPVAGDLRLLIARRNDEPIATLYRAVVPNTPKDQRVAFSSPSRTIYFDDVAEITDQVKIAEHKRNFEVSIPLKAIGLNPAPGRSILADFGVLRGAPGRTRSRAYWSNETTGLTTDVPGEAMIRPALWGRIMFEKGNGRAR